MPATRGTRSGGGTPHAEPAGPHRPCTAPRLCCSHRPPLHHRVSCGSVLPCLLGGPAWSAGPSRSIYKPLTTCTRTRTAGLGAQDRLQPIARDMGCLARGEAPLCPRREVPDRGGAPPTRNQQGRTDLAQRRDFAAPTVHPCTTGCRAALYCRVCRGPAWSAGPSRYIYKPLTTVLARATAAAGRAG